MVYLNKAGATAERCGAVGWDREKLILEFENLFFSVADKTVKLFDMK